MQNSSAQLGLAVTVQLEVTHGQVDSARIPRGLALSLGCRGQDWLHGDAKKVGVHLYIMIFLL